MFQLIRSKPRRFWIVVASVALGIMLVLSLIFKFAVHIISVESETSFTARAITADGESSDVLRLFNLYVVPRDAVAVELSNTETRATARASTADTPFIGIGAQQVTLTPQKAVTKIGRHALDCIITNTSGAYSYDCAKPTEVVALGSVDQGEWGNIPHSALYDEPFSVTPYKSGILAATLLPSQGDFASQVRLTYLEPRDIGQTVTQYATHDIPFESDHTLAVAADTSGADNFAIINASSGKIYAFDDLYTKTDEFDRKASFATGADIASCSLSNRVLACYYGEPSTATTGERSLEARDAARQARGGAYGAIERLELDGDKNHTTANTRTVAIDRLCVTKDHAIITARGTTIASATVRDGRSVGFRTIATDATDSACGNTAVYSTQKGVFEATDRGSQLLFGVDHLKIAGVSTYADQTTFTALVDTGDLPSDKVVHAYRIDRDTDVTGERIEDVLPYAVNDEHLPISDFDYGQKLIYIRPSAFHSVVDESGATVNQTEIDINARLWRDGVIDSDNSRAVYYAEE